MKIQTSAAEIESDIQQIGGELLRFMENFDATKGRLPWVDRLFHTMMEDDELRIQALRFVDVMPSLRSDRELLRHFREYFPAEKVDGFPPLLRWGAHRAARPATFFLAAPTIRMGVKRLAKRFISGERMDEAVAVARDFARQGAAVSLDLLGEAAVSEKEAEGYQQRYLHILDSAGSELGDTDIRETDGYPGFDLSVKVSSLFSQMSPVNTDRSVAVLFERLVPLFRLARRQGLSVTLDMEKYDYKNIILGVFKELLEAPEFRDWPHAGIALQAYLRDTDDDVTRLIDWANKRGTPVLVRLVRGAYWDAETVIARQQGWSVPVWERKSETDACFERCVVKLLQNRKVVRAAFATHNLRSAACAMAAARALNISEKCFEFQTLYGMAEGLRAAVLNAGYQVRVYLPFGDLLPGIAYLVRRLLENSSSQSILKLMGSLDRKDAVLSVPRSEGESEDRQAGPEENVIFRNEPLRRFVDVHERQRFADALARVQEEAGQTYHSMVPQVGDQELETIESRNPSRPDQVVGFVQAAAREGVEAAVGLARKALPEWKALSFDQRAALLEKAADRLRAERDSFAALEVFEAGKNWVEADADVAEAVDFLRFYASRARSLEQRRRYSRPGEENELSYEGLGIGVVIPPWNFPLAIPVGMLSAGIVCGNAVILKPSSLTPVVAHRFCRLLLDIGVPEGIAICLPGSGGRIGDALVQHPQIHFIAFTGSREVGLRINELAARRSPDQRHVKRVIAEMGGKNAIIVDSDADLDEAVAGVLQSAFGYQGQKCSACSRVITVGDVHDSFLDRLVAGAHSLSIGDPVDPENFMGPLIDEQARDRIRDVIEDGKRWAKVVYGRGDDIPERGYYLGPVIFDQVPVDSPLAQDEIFGPVLSVLHAKTFAGALEIANGTRYALTGGVYSRSPENLGAARRGFQVGNLYLNRKITHALVSRQPFGGFKLSGMGSKAGGPDYLLQFLRARNLTENTLRRGFTPEFR